MLICSVLTDNLIYNPDCVPQYTHIVGTDIVQALYRFQHRCEYPFGDNHTVHASFVLHSKYAHRTCVCFCCFYVNFFWKKLFGIWISAKTANQTFWIIALLRKSTSIESSLLEAFKTHPNQLISKLLKCQCSKNRESTVSKLIRTHTLIIYHKCNNNILYLTNGKLIKNESINILLGKTLINIFIRQDEPIISALKWVS